MTEAEEKFVTLIRQCIQGALTEGVEPRHICASLEWESKSIHHFAAAKGAQSSIIKPFGS